MAPKLAFDRGPGDLFMVRVAGNVVIPEEGALEHPDEGLEQRAVIADVRYNVQRL